MSNDPLKTSVSEGLAKMHEASEFIPKKRWKNLQRKPAKMQKNQSCSIATSMQSEFQLATKG